MAFSNNYINSGNNLNLPPQMILSKEKDEDWKKACLDSLEQIGKTQHNRNLKLLENYEMVKGRFVFSHYFEDEGYADLINNLTKEFELPSYLRHYDIISQVINTMSGEWQKRPDNFRVKSYGERYENDFLRAKTDMILNYIQYNINNEINNKLLSKGIDPNKQDFKSEEEKQQYIQLVEEQKQVLTPPEIEVYMQSKWMQIAEIWAQNQLQFDKEKFKLAEKEKREFEDMLVSDRCFRHFYISGDSYEQETWNPINTFFHKSPDTEYIEEGDYVGRVFYLSVNDVIDRYGWMMNQDELEKLRGDIDSIKWKSKDAHGLIHGSVIPYEGFGQHKVLVDTIGYNPMTTSGVSTVGPEFFAALHKDTYSVNTTGLQQVTEAYWKSQKKIGKVTYIDENGELVKLLVDDTFIPPKNFTEIQSTLYSEDEPFTICWTWVNEVWKGIKISARNLTNLNEDIYIGIKPLEFQFKGDINPYNSKLPVCGQIFSVRNSQSMSLVDLMKPHQIGFNVAMNQLYQIMEREIGRFIVMDVNMFPGLKDWGGERAWEKFMIVAKNLGMAPVDTSPQNNPQSANVQGGHYPKDINLDESARMVSRMKIAEFFEMSALKQVGFNSYRVGDYASTSTAQGIEQGKSSSYAQTESHFTNFSNYLRRCYTMNLDIAQYVQSKKEDITISYIKSDLSRAYIKIAGTELLGNQIGIFVSNSQEQLRQLEMLRQLALENNTSGATLPDLAEVITLNSPQEIKLQLRKSFNEQQKRNEQQFQLEQQQLETQKELANLKEDREDIRQDKELESKEKIAYINTFSRQDNNLQDTDSNSIPDLLEYEKLNQNAQSVADKNSIEREKLNLEKQKEINKKEKELMEISLKKKEIDANIQIQNKELEYARIMKGKENKNKK